MFNAWGVVAIVFSIVISYFVGKHEVFQHILNFYEKETISDVEVNNFFEKNYIMNRPYVLGEGKGKEEKMREFTDWAKNHGIEFDKVSIKNIAGRYQGVVAIEDIEKGDILLRVPINLTIREKTFLKNKRFGPIIKDIRATYHTGKVFELVLFLLYHKHVLGEKSKMKAYIQTLPETYDHFPFVSLTKKELEDISGTALFVDTLERRKEYYNYYKKFEKIKELYPEFFWKVDFTEFLWGQLTVGSRTLTSGSETFVIPFIDKLNCEELPFSEDNANNSRTIVDFDMDDRMAVVNSIRDFKKSEEVLNTYGGQDLISYLNGYGFWLENYPDPCVYLSLPLNPESRKVFNMKEDRYSECVKVKAAKRGLLPIKWMTYLRWYALHVSGHSNMKKGVWKVLEELVHQRLGVVIEAQNRYRGGRTELYVRKYLEIEKRTLNDMKTSTTFRILH